MNSSTSSFAESSLEVAAFHAEPYVTHDEEYPGFLYEIVKEAFARSSLKASISLAPMKRGKAQLDKSQVSAAFPALMIQPENYVYSEPIFSLHDSALVRADAKLDPKAKFNFSDYAWDDEYATTNIDMVNSGRKPFAHVDPYVTADALTGRRSGLLSKLKFIPRKSTVEYYVVFRRKAPRSPELIKLFNMGLARIKREGIYQTILERYGYQDLSQDPKQVSIALPDSFEARMIKDLSADFMRTKPDTEIHWYLMNEERLRKRITISQLVRDQFFDAFSLEPSELFVHREMGFLAGFDCDILKSSHFKDLFAPLQKAVEHDGTVYAMPYQSYSNLTYYRKDLFDAKGLKMPPSPTFSQLVELAKKLHDPAKGIFGICMRGKAGLNENMYVLQNLFTSANGRSLEGILKPDIDNPAWNRVVSAYTDALLTSGPPKPWSLGYKENLELFTQGKCAIWPDVSSASGQIFHKESSRVSKRTAIADPPYVQVQKSKNLLRFRAIGISAESPHKRLLQEFLQWLNSNDYQNLVMKRYGQNFFPYGIRNASFASPQFKNLPFSAIIRDSFRVTTQYGFPAKEPARSKVIADFHSIWPTFCELLGGNVNEVLEGKTTVQEAMAASQRKARAIYYHSRD